MTWRGRVKDGVVVLEAGASLAEGSEVLIEAFPATEAEDELAFAALKAKLQSASTNADKGEFFTPGQVLGQIAELRARRKCNES